ncbi:nucleoside:proton symporter [Altererythrobacter sp. KTW20L]|uniref:NupC/NupG family nucleoside CNT transporter n=1 Tax=Altererythrobacter sp. KTW20L TaxID=2942210 RepID=UPI0020C117BA|nr:nucleoside transporter C-terminal domain-containing protein [Altererythrobacter sp. KTW20L]MCL6250777.1 nucleoside:proton symporter [Altererythrobacter sp. KTW20L]
MNLQGVVGLAAVLLLAWALSEDRNRRPSLRWIGGALLLQFAIALVVTQVPFVWTVVGFANEAVFALERATLAGSSYMFGYLGGAPLPFALAEGASPPVVIAFQILPLIIVLSTISALLWHWGILRAAVRGLAWALRRTLGVSGVVGLGGGGTIFLGVVETPLILRAWFERMSRAELFAVMVMVMATISGAILVLYATTLSATVPNAVGHMIVASLISLPAALLIARLMVPGDGSPGTDAGEPDLAYDSSMDAAVRGTMDGMQLVLAVIAVIIVVFALVNLVDQVLALLPFVDGSAITLRRVFGWLFAPLMWSIGVPWSEAPAAGALMGTKAILNEYVAYLDLAAVPDGTLSARSLIIVTYALSGVANLASVGLIVTTVGSLCPARRKDVAALGMKSWLAGNLATLMTGAVIGLVTWS